MTDRNESVGPDAGDAPDRATSKDVGAEATAGDESAAAGSAPADASPSPAPEDGSVGGGDPGDPLTTATRERDEYLDTLRRVQADFENYKKRIIRQQTEHLERAAEGIVGKLLPALDALDLARSHHDPDGEAGKALGAVHSALFDALSKEGLERIDPLGEEFDPTEAEAVMHEPADEGSDGAARHEVVEVLRPGYRWRGRVLRAAMVKVKG